MSWGPSRTSGESSSPPKPQRSVSPLQRSEVAGRVAKTAAVVNAMKRSVSPLSRATSSAQAIGRAVKAAAAANAIARSASPRSALVGDWTDPKKLKEIAKDLQRQLQRKESDALRLNDRVQKLVALRDEQLIESQAERKRLHYALEQEEVEVQRLKGKSSELHEALAAEMAARRVDQQELQMRMHCKDCAEERRQKAELMADCQRLRTEVMEFDAMKIQMQRLRSNQDRMRDQLVDDMRALIAHHSESSTVNLVNLVNVAETSPREASARPAHRAPPSVYAADVLPDDFGVARVKWAR